MFLNKKNILSLLPYIIVVFFSFISVTALLVPGLPPTHDGEYHIIRFYEFDKVLREGVFYPRWAPDLNYGFGVPLFNYVYPLPNYLASFFHLLNFSFIDSFKLNLFFATIFGSIFFYLWARQFWGNAGGVVSSIFYTYSPYHFVDIYIRGSVGEVWAICFFPAFLWSITRVMKTSGSKNNFILPGIFLALIIFSHNILALMFLFFSIAYVVLLILISKEKRKKIRKIVFSFLIGLGLSSIFWIPAILEKNYVTGLQLYNVKDNFPELYQLIFPSWGSGFSKSDLQNQMSFQIGIANLLITFLIAIGLAINYKKIKDHKSIVLFFLLEFIFLVFLILDKSIFIWGSFPFINYFQFPWRLLSILTLVTSFMAGSFFYVFIFRNNILKLFIAGSLILLVFFSAIDYAKPAYYHNRNDSYYTSRSNFIDGTNSPGDYFNTIWSNKKLKKENRKAIIAKGKGKLLEKNLKSTSLAYFVEADDNLTIRVNITYFPGWKAFAGNKEVFLKEKDGLMFLYLPKGTYSLEIKLTDTLIRQASNSISAFSFLLIMALLLKPCCVKIIR